METPVERPGFSFGGKRVEMTEDGLGADPTISIDMTAGDVVKLLHSHEFDFISLGLGVIAILIAVGTLWAVRNQIKIAQQQLKTAQEQLTTSVDGLASTIEASRHVSRDQRRVATLDFILKLETDREHLIARKLFAEIRDKGENTGFTFKHLVETYLSSKRAGKLQEDEDLESNYQNFISYMNILELTSVGIQAGTLDEDVLKSWHRRAYVRNVTAAKEAITVMQNGANAAVFKEALELACAWASGEDEKNRLGQDACNASRTKLEQKLAELGSLDSSTSS